MIRPAGSARVGEYEDALGAGHERCGVGLGRSARSRLKFLGAVRGRDEALGSTRHLGNGVVAEVGEDAIEHRGDRRESAELLDEIVPRGFGLRIGDRVTVVVDQRARAHLASVVAVVPHLLDGKRTRQIVDNRFAR